MDYNFATSSIIGSSHQKLLYNNQDAFDFYQDKNIIVGVVADGCGSGTNSEVGARLGVNFIVNFCKNNFGKHKGGNTLFEVEKLKDALLNYLENIVRNQQTTEELEFIENYLFFTLFGFVITPKQTHIFHSGDGMYILNEQKVVIEQDNRPKYVAKNLISKNIEIETTSISTPALNRLMVATDGLLHLDDKLTEGIKVSDLQKIEDMFDEDNYFDDMAALPKLLTDLAINKNILKDDTTLIMLKQK